jgi:hypothetical protein
MKKVIGSVVVAVLMAVPGFAQKVQIDYAHDFDFESVKTFQYVITPDSDITGNDLMADRVISMIKQEMREGGLKEVSVEPDIYLTYHFTTAERKSYTTTHLGYGGHWGGWGGWGGPTMGSSTTSERSYTEGTLIIDAFDSKEKKMTWRGTGTVTLKTKPEKQIKQVDNILAKLGDKWDKILAGKGK